MKMNKILIVLALVLGTVVANLECTVYFRDSEDPRELQQITEELMSHLGREQIRFGEVKAKGIGLRMTVTLPDL